MVLLFCFLSSIGPKTTQQIIRSAVWNSANSHLLDHLCSLFGRPTLSLSWTTEEKKVIITTMLNHSLIWTVLSIAVMFARLVPMSLAEDGEVVLGTTPVHRLLKATSHTPPTYKKPLVCPKRRRTKDSLDSCDEQEKCFTISYKQVHDDPYYQCAKPTCGYRWKVCIEINNKNPCCNKKKHKSFFRKACIRGLKNRACLDDSDSVGDARRIKKLHRGEVICEFVRPGDEAIFQLVSLLDCRERTCRMLDCLTIVCMSVVCGLTTIAARWEKM